MVRTFELDVPRPSNNTVPLEKKTGEGLSILKLPLGFVMDALRAVQGPFKDEAYIKCVVVFVQPTCSCARGQLFVRPSEHFSHFGYLFGVPQPM